MTDFGRDKNRGSTTNSNNFWVTVCTFAGEVFLVAHVCGLFVINTVNKITITTSLQNIYKRPTGNNWFFWVTAGIVPK